MDDVRLIDLASQFAAICGAAHVQRGDTIDSRYQSDWLGTKESAPAIVVRPGETAEVAAAVGQVHRIALLRLESLCD